MPPKLSWTQRVKFGLVSWFGAWLVRIWFATIRVEMLHQELYETYVEHYRGKENAIAVFWHRNILMLMHFFRKTENVAILVSQSRDGEYIARVLQRLGYQTIRGSSSRGGRSALRGLIRYMQSGKPGTFCGTPVDGPRGPARRMKKGLLLVAKASGVVLAPIACSGTRVFTFKKAWDQTMLPLPFSKVVVDFHTPVAVPPDAGSEEMDAITQQVEDILNQMSDRLDHRCGYVSPDTNRH